MKFNPSVVKDRASMMRDVEQIVREERVSRVSFVAPESGLPSSALPLENENEFRQVMDAVAVEARREIQKSGLDPDNLPDWKTTTETVGEKAPESLLKTLREPVTVGKIHPDILKNMGLPDDANQVVFSAQPKQGGDVFGLIHNWKHHKEVFANPREAEAILRETLRNPGVRVSVTYAYGKKTGKTIKRLILRDSKTNAYTVLIQDENHYELASFHRGKEDYANRQNSFRIRK